MVWSKKEIYVTTSLGRFSMVRDLLAGHGIRYESRREDPNAMRITPGFRTTSNHMGAGNTCQYVYKVYVHRKDVEKANEVLRQLVK